MGIREKEQDFLAEMLKRFYPDSKNIPVFKKKNKW